MRGRAGAAPGRQGVHDLERRKRALGEDLADGDGSVAFVPRMLPVHPRQHVLRAEELVSREGPGFAAQNPLLYASTSRPHRERGAGAAGAGPEGGAENRSHCLLASDHMWRRIACATGASSSATLCMAPATTTPSRKGRNTFVSTASQVSATSASVAVRLRDRASRYASMSGPAPVDAASVGNSTMAEETRAAEAMAAATGGGRQAEQSRETALFDGPVVTQAGCRQRAVQGLSLSPRV